MDNRRQHVSYQNRGDEQPNRTFIIAIAVYILIGFIPGFLATQLKSFFLGMIVFYSYFILMIVMALITDFSSVLLDTSDNTIILPRPVSGRTLYVARLLHIMIYLGLLALGLSIIPTIMVGYVFGITILIPFFILTIIATITALLLTNTFYLLVMRFASEEKLRVIINYFQIVMTVLMMGSYMIFARSAAISKIESMSLEASWWFLLLPSAWFAALMDMIQMHVVDAKHIVMSLCALTIPFLGFYLISKYLTPMFNKKLGALVADRSDRKKSLNPRNWLSRVGLWINKTPAERASFELVYRLFGRDRKLQLKIYPSIGLILVYAVIYAVRSDISFADILEHPQQSKYHVALFYLPYLLIQIASREIVYSDEFKASWVYFSVPLKFPGEILSGMIKALILRLLLPAYAVISIGFMVIFGVEKFDEVIFGLLNNYLMVMTLMSIQAHYLPFSMASEVRNRGGDFIRNVLSAVVITTIAFGHYLLSTKPIFLDAMIPVQLAVAIYLHQAYRKLTWNDVTL